MSIELLKKKWKRKGWTVQFDDKLGSVVWGIVWRAPGSKPRGKVALYREDTGAEIGENALPGDEERTAEVARKVQDLRVIWKIA